MIFHSPLRSLTLDTENVLKPEYPRKVYQQRNRSITQPLRKIVQTPPANRAAAVFDDVVDDPEDELVDRRRIHHSTD